MIMNPIRRSSIDTTLALLILSIWMTSLLHQTDVVVASPSSSHTSTANGYSPLSSSATTSATSSVTSSSPSSTLSSSSSSWSFLPRIRLLGGQRRRPATPRQNYQFDDEDERIETSRNGGLTGTGREFDLFDTRTPTTTTTTITSSTTSATTSTTAATISSSHDHGTGSRVPDDDMLQQHHPMNVPTPSNTVQVPFSTTSSSNDNSSILRDYSTTSSTYPYPNTSNRRMVGIADGINKYPAYHAASRLSNGVPTGSSTSGVIGGGGTIPSAGGGLGGLGIGSTSSSSTNNNNNRYYYNNNNNRSSSYSSNYRRRGNRGGVSGRSGTTGGPISTLLQPMTDWYRTYISPNIKNWPKIQCRIEPTTILKIRKTFRPLKTIVRLGADFNTQLGVWQFKSSWEDEIIGGKITLAGREIQLTKSWQLSVGAVEDLVTRLRFRAAVDLQTWKAYARVGFRTERLSPINVMEGFTLLKQIPLDGNKGHVKLEVKANFALPEPEIEYSTETQRSLVGMGDIEINIEELNLVLDY